MLTALVVDDSAGARTRVATLLRLGGWEVHEAIGTEAALDLAEDARPDLVVTDFVLRGGNGAALLQRLRNEGCRARTVVVATQLTHLVREHAAAAGAFACLAKPVDPRELLDVMRALAGNSAPRVRPRPVAPEPIRIDAERLDQVEQRPASDLPLRLPAIASGADRSALVHVRVRQILALSAGAHGDRQGRPVTVRRSESQAALPAWLRSHPHGQAATRR